MATIDKTAVGYHDSSNTRIRKLGTYIGPVSYVTGGDPISNMDLGMGKVELIQFGVATNGTLYRALVFVPGPNNNSGFIRWLDATNGTEIANGANLSAYSTRFEAIGK